MVHRTVGWIQALKLQVCHTSTCRSVQPTKYPYYRFRIINSETSLQVPYTYIYTYTYYVDIYIYIYTIIYISDAFQRESSHSPHGTTFPFGRWTRGAGGELRPSDTKRVTCSKSQPEFPWFPVNSYIFLL